MSIEDVLLLAMRRKKEGITRYTMTAQFRGEVRAPDFPAGLDWINSDHPLHIKELRGRIVVLHFWTFC